MTGGKSADGSQACNPGNDEKGRVSAEWARLLSGEEIPALELAERLANARDFDIATAQDAVYDALEEGPLIEESVGGFGSVRLDPEHAVKEEDNDEATEQQPDAETDGQGGSETEQRGDSEPHEPSVEAWTDAAFDDPETVEDDDGETHRARGRGFVGPDAEAAEALLASVREQHVAQAAGRYARNADDPEDRAVVFVRTDATPPGFADLQVPGVEWLPTDRQRAIVAELRSRPSATAAQPG